MALITINAPSGKFALGSDAVTAERGILYKVTNRTGHASIKGEVVGPSTSADGEVILNDSGFDPIGVVQEAGVAEGSEMWVWGCGSICQVMMKDSTAAVRGQVMLADDVDGRAYCVAVPSSNPVVAEHFRELGHCLQSKDAGTNVLTLCVLHFN